MTVEDLILMLCMTYAIKLNAWDQKLIYSFADQLGRGTGFTEKQAALALKMVKRHAVALSAHSGKDIVGFVDTPIYKYPFRKINNTKSISVVQNSQLGKVIKVEFPYNEETVKSIRETKDKSGTAVWDKDEKAWLFSLCESNILFLLDLANKEQFQIDESFDNYQNQAREVIENMEQYVPMLVLDQKIPKILNSPKGLPELKTTEMLAAIFEARKYGIFAWSEEFSEYLDSDKVSKFTAAFLKSEPNTSTTINSEKTDISCLVDIIKYLSPCLVVVPGGIELKKLEMSYNFLKSMGIDEKEMSVMFRLPTENDKGFNDFVKNHHLNSPISENTKIVFISSKLPKPVIKSKIKFHSVINLGFGGVHYSIRDFAGNHENLVFYTEKTEQKELEFGLV